MKTIICILLCLSSVVSKGFNALTNTNLRMPSNGYWVVEQNKKNSGRASVYYYDIHDKIIHAQLIRVRTENLLTTRLKRKLNKKLYLLLLLEAERNEAESDNRVITEKA